MTRPLYYPLVSCDVDDTEKIAIIPTPNANAVRSRSNMWLEEIIPHYFRLSAKKNQPPTDSFSIRCPQCGKTLQRIGRDINESTRGLFVCNTCTKY